MCYAHLFALKLPKITCRLSCCCWGFVQGSALLLRSLIRLCFSGHGKGGTSHAVRAVPKLQSSAGGPSSWQGFKTKGAKKTSAPLNIKSKPRTSAKPGPSKAGKGLKFQTKAGKESRFQRKQ